jgi:hypothetical protein
MTLTKRSRAEERVPRSRCHDRDALSLPNTQQKKDRRIMAKASAVLPPKKGRVPNMAGVAGELVALDGLDLQFGGMRKASPYDALLDQLAAAGPGKLLRFGDERAKPAIYSRSKKKGYKVSFAVSGGALFVRFDGSVDDDVKARRREQILGTLLFGASTPPKLAALLREKGDTTVDGQGVAAILAQLARTGEVVKGEGEQWALNPARKGK